MSDLPTPVAFDFLAAFLDMSETAAGIALLLVGVVAVPGHVSCLPTVVAKLLSLLLRLLAVSGDVTSSATVITGVLGPLTVSGDVSEFPAAITEQIFASAPSFPSSSTATRTVLHPVTAAATPETLITAHHHDDSCTDRQEGERDTQTLTTVAEKDSSN